MRAVTIVAALLLALAACAQDDGTTETSETTVGGDVGTVAPETTTPDTSAPEEGETADFTALNEQAAVISTHVAEADIPEISDGWALILDHLDQLTLDGSVEIDASLAETVSADLDSFDATVQGNAAELSSEFVSDWDSFYADFQAALSMTG